MATTPITDGYKKRAAAGIKRHVADGESVEVMDLDVLRRAAEAETKAVAAAGARRNLGIVVGRVRLGGAAPQ